MMDTYNTYLLYGLFGTYVALLVTAAAFDATKFIIPNAIVVSLVVLFFAGSVLLPFETNWLSHLGAAFAVFAAGLVIYHFGLLGAGDVKLMAAISLWAGFEQLSPLLLYVALSGGALALLLTLMRRLFLGILIAVPWTGSGVLPRMLMIGENLPYGIAIASGSIILASQHPYLGLFII